MVKSAGFVSGPLQSSSGKEIEASTSELPYANHVVNKRISAKSVP